MPQARQANSRKVDFDETCTTSDTISKLTSAAYSLHASSGPPLPPWSYFTDSYMADYANYDAHQPSKEQRTTLGAERTYLTGLDKVEQKSIERIESSGLFKGLNPLDIAAKSREFVDVRQGFWSKLCLPALECGSQVSILSVNWSSVWIRESLRQAAEKEGGVNRFSEVSFYTNDLETNPGSGLTSGTMNRWFIELGQGIWTAAHKLRVMERVSIDEMATGGLVVYIGDSSTDILCLAAADVGIVVGDKLDGMCERIGLKLAGLDAAVPHEDMKGRVLWKVNALTEVGDWITRLQASV